MVSGGAAYAAGHLGKNSVGTKQLKKNSVTTAKIKKNAITGAKVKTHTLTGSDINLGKLGTVPSAEAPTRLSALEGVHVVGAAGEPPFAPGASGLTTFGTINLPPVGFYKDHEGIVHLEGVAKSTGAEKFVFTLPPGYRPPSGIAQLFVGGAALVFVVGSNVSSEGKDLSGTVDHLHGNRASGRNHLPRGELTRNARTSRTPSIPAWRAFRRSLEAAAWLRSGLLTTCQVALTGGGADRVSTVVDLLDARRLVWVRLVAHVPSRLRTRDCGPILSPGVSRVK